MLDLYAPSDPKLIKMLNAGAIVAYPTEGVWGLGCLPSNLEAVNRLRNLKIRETHKGFIIVATTFTQVEDYIKNKELMIESWKHNAQGFVTAIFNASKSCPQVITAKDQSIAIRISSHVTIKTLCQSLDSGLVSTSANYAGEMPAQSISELTLLFAGKIDAIVDGQLGGEKKPSKLIDLRVTPPITLRT